MSGYYNGSHGGTSDGWAPSVLSDGATSMTEDSSVYEYEDKAAETTAETPMETQAREEDERRRQNMAMHVNDHMNLPPFVVNGEAFYSAHELPTSDPTRLIRKADFQRQAEDARLVFTRDPARPWTKDPLDKYPELIEHNRLGMATPLVGHPVVAGSGSYRNGRPGASRAWVTATDVGATSAQSVYHNNEEGKRRHHEEQAMHRQNERKHRAKLIDLRKELHAARGRPQRRRLQLKIAETERKRDNAQKKSVAPFDGSAPFTPAASIPLDTECPPLVPALANPHTHKYNIARGCSVLDCELCGGQTLVNNGQVVESCQCARGT